MRGVAFEGSSARRMRQEKSRANDRLNYERERFKQRNCEFRIDKSNTILCAVLTARAMESYILSHKTKMIILQ